MKIAHLTLVAGAALALGSIAASMSVAVAQTSSSGESKAMAATAPKASLGDADGAFISFSKFSEPDGAKLYNRVCAGCHMPDAKGANGAGHYPALAGNANLAASGYPLMVVLKGLNGMPGVGQAMSDQQVADVVNYVRTHFGNKYKDALKVADVKAAR